MRSSTPMPGGDEEEEVGRGIGGGREKEGEEGVFKGGGGRGGEGD